MPPSELEALEKKMTELKAAAKLKDHSARKSALRAAVKELHRLNQFLNLRASNVALEQSLSNIIPYLSYYLDNPLNVHQEKELAKLVLLCVHLEGQITASSNAKLYRLLEITTFVAVELLNVKYNRDFKLTESSPKATVLEQKKVLFTDIPALKKTFSVISDEYKKEGGFFRKHTKDIKHLQEKADTLLEKNVTPEKLKQLQIYVMSEILRIAGRNKINLQDEEKVVSAIEKYRYFKILFDLAISLQEQMASLQPAPKQPTSTAETLAQTECIRAIDTAFSWYQDFRHLSSWFGGTHMKEMTTLRERSYQILYDPNATIPDAISNLSNYVNYELERMLKNKGYKDANAVPKKEGYIHCLIRLSETLHAEKDKLILQAPAVSVPVRKM